MNISLSCRGNCHDNAVAESFFQPFKRERIESKVYTTRMDARANVFDSTEMFYNRKRRRAFNNRLSPAVFEEQVNQRLESV
jgi:putative transposase